MNWLQTAIFRWHYKRMSEFGRELAEEFKDPKVAWQLNEYVLTHKPSGIEIWIRNGCGYVHIHAMPRSLFGEHTLRTLLNYHDKRVLWTLYKIVARDFANRPAQTAINILRLSKHKENQS